MKKTALISFGTALMMPLVALAQFGSPQGDTTYIDGWIRKGSEWLGTAITVIMILMTIFFLYNVFRYIANKDATKTKDLKNAMIRGLIGLFIAVSVWGIISIARTTFGTTNQAAPGISCPPGSKWDNILNRCVF